MTPARVGRSGSRGCADGYAMSCSAGLKPQIHRSSPTDRPLRAERDRRAVANDGDGDRPPRLDADQMRDGVERRRGRPFTATIRPRPAGRRRPRASSPLRPRDLALGRVRRRAADREDETKMRNAARMFASRPGRDDGDALPRRRAPVRVVATCPPPRRAAPARTERAPRRQGRRSSPRARAPGTRRAPPRSPPPRERVARVARPARALAAPRIAGSSRICRSRAAGRCMPGSRTSPPSGIAPIPYSIPLPLDLHDGRREADVEAPRPHPDRERHAEVPELVDEDEQRRDRR